MSASVPPPAAERLGEDPDRDGAGGLVLLTPDTWLLTSLPLADPGTQVRQIYGRPGEVRTADSGADALVVHTDCA